MRFFSLFKKRGKKKVFNNDMSDMHRKYILKVMKKNLVIVNNETWNNQDRKELNIKYTNECISLLENMVNELPQPIKIDGVNLICDGKVVQSFGNNNEPTLEGL